MKKKTLVRRCINRLFSLLARFSPGSTTVRPRLHRARGVVIGRDVFIGEDVYIDNEYPEAVEIHNGVQISIRAVLIAHTRGPGRLVLEKNCFIGPHSVVACSAGRILRVGEGAVVSAGCVVTKSVPPRAVLTPASAQLVGFASVPLSTAKTMAEFWSGLKPVKPAAASRPDEPPA